MKRSDSKLLLLGITALLGVACEREAADPGVRVDHVDKDAADASKVAKGRVPHLGSPEKGSLKVQKDEPTQLAECLSREQLAAYDPMGFRLRGTFSVVRVARDDTLALREQPSPDAKLVEELAPERGGLKPTGKVCRVGKSHWWQVSVGTKSGWLNSRFVARQARARDATETYKGLAGEKPAPTPWAVTQKVLKSMNERSQMEGRYEASLVDIHVSGSKASARIYACCEPDDSVDGETAELSLVKQGDGWKFESATQRSLCSRGVSQDGSLCL